MKKPYILFFLIVLVLLAGFSLKDSIRFFKTDQATQKLQRVKEEKCPAGSFIKGSFKNGRTIHIPRVGGVGIYKNGRDYWRLDTDINFPCDLETLIDIDQVAANQNALNTKFQIYLLDPGAHGAIHTTADLYKDELNNQFNREVLKNGVTKNSYKYAKNSSMQKNIYVVPNSLIATGNKQEVYIDCIGVCSTWYIDNNAMKLGYQFNISSSDQPQKPFEYREDQLLEVDSAVRKKIKDFFGYEVK